MSDNQVKGVDQSFRRTWDKDAAEKRAQEREARELSDPSEKHIKAKSLKDMKPVQAREEELDLETNVGKFIAVSSGAPESKQGGFYCDMCECHMKDSQNFLDHINGKKHQRLLGTSLHSERATLQQVRERLRRAKEKTLAPKAVDDFEEKMRRLREQEERRKEEDKEKKKELIKKKKEIKKKEEEDAQDPLLLEMGLPSGFGTTQNKGNK